MKKVIAVVYFILITTAVMAHNPVSISTFANDTPKPEDKNLGMNTVAHATESGKGKGAIVSAAAHTRNSLRKSLRIKKEKFKTKYIDNLQFSQDNPNQDNPNQDNPSQEPRKKENEITQEAKPQEIKTIPKARRAKRPAKVDGDEAPSATGNAKRPAAAANQNRAGKPNVAGNPNRAGRPAGAGRPPGAGRPGGGKGKN